MPTHLYVRKSSGSRSVSTSAHPYAMDWSPPAKICNTLHVVPPPSSRTSTAPIHGPTITCGTLGLHVPNTPSCPLAPSPNPYTLPRDGTKASACRRPQAIWLTGLPINSATILGSDSFRVAPWPSWPNAPRPHVKTPPSSVRNVVKSSPAATYLTPIERSDRSCVGCRCGS